MLDAIDVIRVRSQQLRRGVNRPEVDGGGRDGAALAAERVTSVGVITPFRAQADAIESALAAALSVEELERPAVRVGTVHAFQGDSYPHTVVVSSRAPLDRRLGLACPVRDAVTRSCLTCMVVTRARQRLIVITSLSQPGRPDR